MKNFVRTLTKDEADAEDLMLERTLRVLNNYDKFVDNVIYNQSYRPSLYKLKRSTTNEQKQGGVYQPLRPSLWPKRTVVYTHTPLSRGRRQRGMARWRRTRSRRILTSEL